MVNAFITITNDCPGSVVKFRGGENLSINDVWNTVDYDKTVPDSNQPEPWVWDLKGCKFQIKVVEKEKAKLCFNMGNPKGKPPYTNVVNFNAKYVSSADQPNEGPYWELSEFTPSGDEDMQFWIHIKD
jgi:hypothetical protein